MLESDGSCAFCIRVFGRGCGVRSGSKETFRRARGVLYRLCERASRTEMDSDVGEGETPLKSPRMPSKVSH